MAKQDRRDSRAQNARSAANKQDGRTRGSRTNRAGRRGRNGRGGGNPQATRNVPTAENISLFDEDQNAYAASVQAGHRIDPRAQKIFVMGVILVAFYAIALVIPKDMLNEALTQSGYNTGYTFSWFVSSLQENVNGIVGFVTGHDAEVGYSYIVFRYLIIIMAGAGLAVCGAVYQGSFRNALVSPSSMGVMSGAGAGMMLWVLFYVNDECTNVPWVSNVVSGATSTISAESDFWGYLWAQYSMCIYSFIGCALIAGLVLMTMILSKRASTSGLMIIITGQVFGGIIGSFTSIVRYYMTEVDGYSAKLELLNMTSIGSFYRDYSWIDIVAVGIPIVLCLVVVLRLRQRMMALSLGHEEARSLGVDSKRTQIAVVAVATLLTAIIVSFCGRIGFVGFLIPHLARRFVGPSFKYLVPASMVLGGLFVLIAYLIVACTLGPDYETMVGMFISIGGAAIFLVQALRGAGGGGGIGRGIFR